MKGMKTNYFLYHGRKVRLVATQYGDLSLAVLMYGTGEYDLIDVITMDVKSPYQSETDAFLDIHTCPDIESFIVDNKLGRPLHYREYFNGEIYPLYTLYTEQF